jgi:hypothetical protein
LRPRSRASPPPWKGRTRPLLRSSMATSAVRRRAGRMEHPRPGHRGRENQRTRSRIGFALCKAERRALLPLPNQPAAPRATRAGKSAQSACACSRRDAPETGKACVQQGGVRSQRSRRQPSFCSFPAQSAAQWDVSPRLTSLDTVRSCLKCWPRCGRLAQRESVPFTRERSQVQSLQRPPFFNDLSAVAGSSRQNIT